MSACLRFALCISLAATLTGCEENNTDEGSEQSGDPAAASDGGTGESSDGAGGGGSDSDPAGTDDGSGSDGEDSDGAGGESVDDLEFCASEACPGPAPGAPNRLCEDGSFAGPACVRDAAGDCGWRFLDCPVPDDEDPGKCDMDCPEGTECRLVEVQCITDPCPPVAECVRVEEDADPPACGGFAGFECPGEGVCVDDPDDDCRPGTGADCGGICECEERRCRPGQTFNDDPHVCDCEASNGGGIGDLGCAVILCAPGTTCVETDEGAECVARDDVELACGDTTCERGQVCCNPSCGVCTEPDGFCTQQICD